MSVLVPSLGCSVAAAARTRSALPRGGLRGAPGGEVRDQEVFMAHARSHEVGTQWTGPRTGRTQFAGLSHLVATLKPLREAVLLLLKLEDAIRCRSCVENAMLCCVWGV